MRQASHVFKTAETALLSTKLLPQFERDGSLRDLYVHNTGFEDHDQLVSSLVSSGFKIEISPPFNMLENFNAAGVFDYVQSTEPVRMRVSLSKDMIAHCHFFTPDELELDLDPRDVRSESDVARILEFMKTIGKALVKDVVLAHENSPGDTIVTYQPASGEFLLQ